MGDRMLTNNVDDRHFCSTCVMQVGETVGEPGPQMKERARRLPGHASEAVRRCRYYPFEETKYTAHFRQSIECCDDVHLRCTRVCETGFNSSVDQRANQAFCAVHRFPSVRSSRTAPGILVERTSVEFISDWPLLLCSEKAQRRDSHNAL